MAEVMVPAWVCACGVSVTASPGDPAPIGDLAAVEGWTEVGDGTHYCPACLAGLKVHDPEPHCATCGYEDREFGPWCRRCYAVAVGHVYLRVGDGTHYCPACLAGLKVHDPEPHCATCGYEDREFGPWCRRCYAVAVGHVYLRLAEMSTGEDDGPAVGAGEAGLLADLGAAAARGLLAVVASDG